MSNRLALLLLCLFTAMNFAIAEEAYEYDFKEEKFTGYIMKKDGSKVDGYIIPGTITDNEVKVKFIRKGMSKVVSYKPMDIKGYGYQKQEFNDVGKKVKSWVHYETHMADYPPKPFASKTVFMQKEVDGEVELFCYYIEVRNNPKQPYKYVHYYRDAEGAKLKKIEEKDFRRVSKELFNGYTALETSIGKKNFEYKNLERMVRDYNYWTDNQHDSDTYRVALKEN